jgi:hypothetical protein
MSEERSEGRATFLKGVIALGVLAPWLLFSSPEYRQFGLLVAMVISLGTAGAWAWKRHRPLTRPVLLCFTGLAVCFQASVIGGVLSGEPAWETVKLTLCGVVGILGIAVATDLFLCSSKKRSVVLTAVGLLAFLVISSYLGYLFSIEKHIKIGGYPEYLSSVRIALIWPTRILMEPFGQIGWEHTNLGGFYFAVGILLILNGLANGLRFAWAWWLFAVMLGVSLFLTGSRGAWLMLGVALPLVLIGRNWRFWLKSAVLIFMSYALGTLSLETKIQIDPQVTGGSFAAPAPATNSEHNVGALLERGSAGRLDAYRFLWDELADSRIFGTGLSAAGKKMRQLTHEHSSYLATFRCSGFIGIAGHLLIIGTSLWAAFGHFRKGVRWPLIFLVAVLVGILFDRSNVFALTGQSEFIFHWVAIWIPVLGNFPTAREASEA